MKTLKRIFEQNRAWAEEIRAREPEFFHALARQQSPDYLWIGCSDSRVPATQLAGLSPGEMFVHRNVANLVVHTDLNCLSVMQYAVEVLRVRHIIVCGHYGCGGVQAAIEGASFGLIDNWLRHVQDVMWKHAAALEQAGEAAARLKLLCELNVVEQVWNVCRTTVVQSAWERGQELSVHGWVYGLDDGLLRDLDVCITCPAEFAAAQRTKGV
ncbi:MAG TPA: carbonate dehydratase [Pyrinomonadaceae bacterium]|jgi:carbonic anhydrase|nr:carbonate dehydratase [Pyrinomonadaceae bacterium]